MRSVPLKKLKYYDPIAKKRQRRFLARTVSWFVGGAVLIIALGYSLFFSGWFKVEEVGITGLAEARAEEITKEIDDRLAKNWLGIPVGRNIILFPSSRTEKYLTSKFPFILDVNIKKDYFHGLIIEASERNPEGIWCFGPSKCFYYDSNAILIAPAPQSSGFLTLTINDQRAGIDSIDSKFFKAVRSIDTGLKAQGIEVKSFNIPAGTFTEIDAQTDKGYPIKFSIDSDLQAQLHALEVFREQRLDPKPPYHYLDLRFDGRVYFK